MTAITRHRRPRRRSAVLLATLTAVALGAAGTIALVGHRNQPVPHEAGPDIPTTAPLLTASPASPVTWVNVAGAAVVVSADGPRHDAHGLASGFAHTPFGAVLAAVHITVRLTPQAGPDVYEPTLHDQVIGADTAALSARLEADYDQARSQLGLPYGVAAGRLYASVAGYRIDSASPAAVALRLLVEGPAAGGGSQFAVTAVEMHWSDGDWRLVAPPAGDWGRVVSPTRTTDGFTLFDQEGTIR
jgi:hypothetical protein